MKTRSNAPKLKKMKTTDCEPAEIPGRKHARKACINDEDENKTEGTEVSAWSEAELDVLESGMEEKRRILW